MIKTEGQKFLLKIVKLTVQGHSMWKQLDSYWGKWVDAGFFVLYLYKSKHEERDLQHSAKF